MPTEQPSISQVWLYKDNADEWRFDAVSENGDVIVESSEGYKNEEDARGAITGTFGDSPQVILREKEAGNG